MKLDRRKFILDTFFTSLPSLAGYLSGFVIMVFITKSIGAAAYGIWSQFQVTFSLLSFFLCLGFGRSIPRFLAGEKEKEYLSKVYYSATLLILIVTVLAGLVFYVFRESLADFLFGGKELGTIVILLIMFLLFRNLSRQSQHLLATQRYVKEWTLFNLAIFGTTALFVALAAAMTENIVATIISFVAIEGLAFLALLGFIWKKGISPTRPSFRSVVPLLKYGVPLIITSIGYWIIQSSDRYLIKYFMDISQVGLYSVGYSCAFVLFLIWTDLIGVLLPDQSALFDEGRKQELEIRFSRVLKYGVALSFPAVVGASILAKPIIITFSSPEFLAAANILMIVSAGVFFYGLFVCFNTLLSVLKKVKILTLIWIGMALLNIILNLWLIPRFGIEGAAVSTSLSFLLGAVIIVLYSRNYFEIIFKKEWLVKIISASALMGFLVGLMNVGSDAYLFLAVFAGILIYGATLWLLKFHDESELLLFKRAFLKNG